jgi:hypothetical protein
MTKRPIDRKRDAGGVMEIGTPDDPSAITAIFPIGDDLYVVKERGVYEVKLADRIDPNRTNIAIPNTHQRVLNYGSDAPVVGRTLLTAKELFNPTYLPKNLDLTQALRLCFETLKDLAAMLDVAAALEQDQLTATRAVGHSLQKAGRSHSQRSATLPPGAKILSRRRITVCNLCLAWCAFSMERMQGDNGSRDSQNSYRSATERAIRSLNFL